MQVVIIGNGVAGITAALELRKRKPACKITIVSNESAYFFSRPALMYIYMGHMRFEDTKPYADPFWDRMRFRRCLDRVIAIDTQKQSIQLENHPSIPYDQLLVATGSQPNRFGWPGQDLEGVQGFYSLQDLHRLEKNSKNLKQAVIVGGGLIGIELAEMLASRGVRVTLLVRESSYWNNVMPNAESAIINAVIREHGIDLRLQCELDQIIDDGYHRACGVVTNQGERLACQLVGLTAGVSPNLSALEGSDIATNRGVLVNEMLGTNLENIYAAGDCAEIVSADGQHRLWQVWYSGIMQGGLAARNMCSEKRPYDPGIWYNSAKFIDLEWHTYGRITCGMDEHKSDPAGCLVWQHASQPQLVRIVHENGRIVGLNALGIRYRHRICERWITERRTLDYVLDHLEEANFDPEFFKRNEDQIKTILKDQMP